MPIEECYYQKALHRLRALNGFDVCVMAGLLLHWSDKGLLANYVTQTSIAHLPREKFMRIPMPVPPLPEQRSIATALSDMDELLGGLDRLIAKKRDLKQAAMQQVLTGKTRLPEFCERKDYKETEIGIIPEDWEVDKVASFASITTGSRNTQDRIEDGQYPFFVRSQTVEKINSYSFDGEAVLTAGDGVGTGKVFHYINGKFDCHQRVYRISNFEPELDGFFGVA